MSDQAWLCGRTGDCRGDKRAGEHADGICAQHSHRHSRRPQCRRQVEGWQGVLLQPFTLRVCTWLYSVVSLHVSAEGRNRQFAFIFQTSGMQQHENKLSAGLDGPCPSKLSGYARKNGTHHVVQVSAVSLSWGSDEASWRDSDIKGDRGGTEGDAFCPPSYSGWMVSVQRHGLAGHAEGFTTCRLSRWRSHQLLEQGYI